MIIFVIPFLFGISEKELPSGQGFRGCCGGAGSVCHWASVKVDEEELFNVGIS